MSRRFETQDATGILADIPGVGIMLAAGTTVPTDASAGYGTGCLFMHTDGGDATALYVNEGTNTSCNFNAVTVAV